MFVSVISLIVAFVALFYVVCVGVETDHASTLIAVLGTLVTALMGWNIVQYMFAKDEVRRIAKEESDKAANAAAERVQDDLLHMVNALLPLMNARIDSVYNASVRTIGWYFYALNEYNHIQDSTLRQQYVSSLSEELLYHVERWKEEDRLCIDMKYLDDYKSLLDSFDNPSSVKLKELIQSAREETEDDKCFDHISPL